MKTLDELDKVPHAVRERARAENRRMTRHATRWSLTLATVWALAVLPSCRGLRPAAPRPVAELAAEKAGLEDALRALGPSVQPAEARRVARVIVQTVEQARVTSGLTGGAHQRNVAVNLGLHDWGLCWQWTELLGRRLQQESLVTLHPRWACAHAGSTLREHNALVLTTRGGPFADGLVVDPWRRGGWLTWVRVSDDRYPWKHEPWSEARWHAGDGKPGTRISPAIP
jgi:hypothetical protein